MRIIRGALCTAAMFFTLAITGAAAQKADPAVYGALPDVVEVEISPDGKTLAKLHNIEGEAAVLFYGVDSPGAQPTGLNLGEANARSIEWTDNDRAIVLISISDRVETGSGRNPVLEFFRWVVVSKDGSKPKTLFGNEPGLYLPGSGDLRATMPNDPDAAVFTRYSVIGKGRGGLGTVTRFQDAPEVLYSVVAANLKNGKGDVVESGNEDTQDWVVNAGGVPVARVDFDRSENLRKLYVRNEKDDYEMRASFPGAPGGGASVGVLGMSGDPDIAIAASYEGRDKRSLVEVDLENGEIGRTLFTSQDYDIDGPVYDYRRAVVTGVRYTDDLPRTYHLSEADRAVQQSLRKALPGAAPSIVSRSADGARMIVEVVYPDHPKQFFLFDKEARRLDVVASAYSKLDGKIVGKSEQFDYTASDGMRVPGYLTVPAGASRQSMPLIVLPHGGPESRSDQSFDWWAFFYAARGYLVYQPNFRGSDGYGYEFRSAGFGEWGRRMQDDITEGVAKLVADGMVDPNRICIVGASYGGYAALAGATLTPELYQCAVSVNGVSNLVGMLGQRSQYGGLSDDYWERRIGSRFNDAEEINAVSPARQAAKAGAPILLIHARDDVVVPVGQSQEMRSALRDAGKPYEYVELNGEDHWLSTSAARTEMLQRSIEFIDRHIGAN